MFNAEKYNRWKELQEKLLGLASHLDEEELRISYNKELSPIGWHIFHSTYIESLWIREKILNDDSLTKKIKPTACSFSSLKSNRGKLLPNKKDLVLNCKKIMEENLVLLKKIYSKKILNTLIKNNYLEDFIINHHSQHIEIILMILKSKNILQDKIAEEYKSEIEQKKPNAPNLIIKKSSIEIGASNNIFSYDNEKPKFIYNTNGFKVASNPILNSEWLYFMNEHGYQKKEFWSKEGWNWKELKNITHPAGWIIYKNNQISIAHPYGFKSPVPNEAVSGISKYEAEAFSTWSKARLLREFEWEMSYNLISLKEVVWEWSSDFFLPYDNFRPFPYKEYSIPWFDKKHYVLKGCSEFTEKDISRKSFRNFYTPWSRHIFSGSRLACDI